jgi:tRNA wybutosine-synthesizing protein 4
MLVMSYSLPEKGEVISAHYKLVPADLRDVKQLNDIITITEMDPWYV